MDVRKIKNHLNLDTQLLRTASEEYFEKFYVEVRIDLYTTLLINNHFICSLFTGKILVNALDALVSKI